MTYEKYETTRLREGQNIIVKNQTAIFMEYDMESYGNVWVRYKDPERRDESVSCECVKIVGKTK